MKPKYCESTKKKLQHISSLHYIRLCSKIHIVKNTGLACYIHKYCIIICVSYRVTINTVNDCSKKY